MEPGGVTFIQITRQLSRIGVGGVYWTVSCTSPIAGESRKLPSGVRSGAPAKTVLVAPCNVKFSHLFGVFWGHDPLASLWLRHYVVAIGYIASNCRCVEHGYKRLSSLITGALQSLDWLHSLTDLLRSQTATCMRCRRQERNDTRSSSSHSAPDINLN